MSDADTSEPEATPDAEPAPDGPPLAAADTPATPSDEDRPATSQELDTPDPPPTPATTSDEDPPAMSQELDTPDAPATPATPGDEDRAAMSQELVALRKGVDELVRLTRRSDEHVADLHAENQKLRAGELAGATAPLLRDLVRLHDEVGQLRGSAAPEALADLDLVRSRLLDTLARWGLTPFAPAVGDAVDATRHHGVGRVPSAEGVPGAIATVRRTGFAHDDGRTFRAAEVEVFQALPAPPSPAPDTAPATDAATAPDTDTAGTDSAAGTAAAAGEPPAGDAAAPTPASPPSPAEET